MLFEGSEKKVEVHFSSKIGDLRDRGREWWSSFVAVCEAQILSEIHTEDCTAYLLSESSLFVWKDRLTLITCGRTQLVRSILFLAENIDVNQVESLIFERKNEYFPHMQKTDFFADIRQLQERFQTEDFRFGDVDGHHLFLSHIQKGYRPEKNDRTIELLMYNLKETEVSQLFVTQGVKREQIRASLPFEEWLPGFQIDDYVFDPFGYSLNALRGSDYYTLHVTPQEGSSYVSFETNASDVNCEKLVKGVTDWLQPQSFDLVTFDAKTDESSVQRESKGDLLQVLNQFQLKTFVKETLNCGYEVNYRHFFIPEVREQRAFRIES